MKVFADLHLHSKYSRACSKDLDIANLEKYAKIKGLGLLGTSDFTHPKWRQEIKSNLSEESTGLLKTKEGFPFILQTEISLMYSQDGKGRRVHIVILAPSLEVSDQITEYLGLRGRLDYDGRPIFKISAENLTADLMHISKDIEVIPAHIWTPWFSLFGSKSGFDNINDCFGAQTKNIHALETGLSSDPPMNWRLSQLDDFNLVSSSDSHSFWPWRIGREATIFDLKELTYKNVIDALRTSKGLTGTIEVNPSYGMYHFDGHRNCGIHFTPKESLRHKNICPICKKPLTIGVLHRVEELADRHEGYKPKKHKMFKSVLPLAEVIALAKGASLNTKGVTADYYKLIEAFGNEFNVLLEPDMKKIKNVVNDKVADYIKLNSEEKIEVIPGYDGEYGVPVFSEEDKKKALQMIQARAQKKGQTGLDEFI